REPQREMSPLRVPYDDPVPRNRTSPHGSFRLDREFTRLGVGRIQLATGLFKAEDFNQLNSCLSRLAANGALDVLRALKDRGVTPAELLAADKKQRSLFIMQDRHEEEERARRVAAADVERSQAFGE